MKSDDMLVRLARKATLDKQPEAALALWTELRQRAPDNPAAILGEAKSLMHLGLAEQLEQLAGSVQHDPALAEQVLAVAAKRPAKHLKLSLAWCAAADARDDPYEAVERWTQLRKLLPAEPAAHTGLVNALIRAGRLDEADRVAAAAAKYFRKNPDMAALAARLATERADWPAAVTRWTRVAKRFRGHANARAHLQHAEQQVADGLAATSAAAVAPEDRWASPQAQQDAGQLLMQFENLGRNCELGLLQRRFGAEPLGLLRFSNTRPQALITLLKSRFDGVGVPEHNEIIVRKGEYRLQHKKTGLTTHTRIKIADAQPDQVLVSQCRHARYLRDKLIEDLEQQTKIFAFQKSDLDDAQIRNIYAALAGYGPNMLLCVRVHKHDKPPGTVEFWEDRLMVGYIDRPGQEFIGAGWNISVDYWLDFCRQASARRDELAARSTTEQAA